MIKEKITNENVLETEIKRLSKLSKIEYAKTRKEAQKTLGLPLKLLDELVQEAQREAKEQSIQGSEISLPEPTPWEEVVDGKTLLASLVAIIRSYVVMDDNATIAAALWAIHSYLYDVSIFTPRLAVISPEKGCGKTTLLDVVGQLVNRPLLTANVTPAVVFRMIANVAPTLLVDEADSFLKGNEELRGILNSGHRKGGQVMRTVGESHEVRAFSTFCPLAIALIGRLPDTLQDRSVVINLRRRLENEDIKPFRIEHIKGLQDLASMIARWAKDNRTSLVGAEPEMPAGLFNRTADNWRPLLAIADAIGGDWPEQVRKAAVELSARNDTASFRTQLLIDIKVIFDACKADKISSYELADKLTVLEGHPWADFNRGKPLTPHSLARLLTSFGITPNTIRIGGNTPKGYIRNQFADVWKRYLSANIINQTATKQQWLELADDFDDELLDDAEQCCDVADEIPLDGKNTNIPKEAWTYIPKPSDN